MPNIGGKKYASDSDASDAELLGPSKHLVKVVDNVAFPEGLCRFLWVGTAGTATITQPNNNVLTDFPLKEGLNPIRCTKVDLNGAADVWAGY